MAKLEIVIHDVSTRDIAKIKELVYSVDSSWVSFRIDHRED